MTDEVTRITITEALADIKTIDKRLQKKRESTFGFLYRQNAVVDPMLHSEPGSSQEFIKRERQAIVDLETYKIKLRTGIQNVNARETITIDGETHTINEWLTWRKEVMPSQRDYLAQIRNRIEMMRAKAQTQNISVVSVSVDTKQYSDVVVNVDEAELAKEIEHIEMVVGTLDGQLSLKNATTFIEL